MKKKKITIASILLSLAMLFTSCGVARQNKNKVKTSQVFHALDTVIEITIYGKDANQNNRYIKESEDFCRTLEKIFSRTEKTSEIYRLNHSPAGTYQVSPHLAFVLERSLYFAKLSAGAFDPTVGAVSSLWNFKQENPIVPTQDEITQGLSYVSYEYISIQGNQYTKKYDQVQLDLGAIAKGYVGDQLTTFLQAKGALYGLINLGGDVVTFGSKEDGTPWVMGIANPDKEKADYLATVSIESGAVVTSGNYQRFFIQDGTRYHHILDPKTGYPTNNGVDSVTVWAENATDADALSTICFVYGTEKGLAFLEQVQLGKVAYWEDNGSHYASPNFDGLVVTE